MIKPIETQYKGYRFRSRLEARWAVFFDALGLEWNYEPEGFDLGSEGFYLPDFFVSNIGCRTTQPIGMWFEVKGVRPIEKEQDKCLALAKQTGQSCGMLYGQIDNGFQAMFIECSYSKEHGDRWDIGMEFMKCKNPNCGKIKFEYSESNYQKCECCGHVCNPDHIDIENAIIKARSARFEHGERG